MSLLPRRTVGVLIAAPGACAALLAIAVPVGPSVLLAGASAPLSTGSSAGLAAGVAVDPASFTPGACLAFPPTRGDNQRTVFLDAGHGGIDPGAVGTTETGAAVEESTINLPVELDTMAILREQGYRVVVSRTVRAFTGGPSSGGLTRDHILDNITLYWLTGTGASAARSYWENTRIPITALTSTPRPDPWLT